MRVESYELQIAKTCRKCYTMFDYTRNYCCAKDNESCFADELLVKKGVQQDGKMAEKLFITGRIDQSRNITSMKMHRGRFRNECMVFNYRPPGCRSHFCWRWNEYIKGHPKDMVYANLNVVSRKTLFDTLRREFEYGIKLAYPGGFIVYVSDENDCEKLKNDIEKLLDGMKIEHFASNAHLMNPEKNEKPGVEIIVDTEGILQKQGLFNTIINNNMFMLVRMKMSMASAGHGHSNIMITTADPEKIATETPASLKSFHALMAFQL